MPYYRLSFSLDLIEESIQTNGNILFKQECGEFSLRCNLLNDGIIMSNFKGLFQTPTQLDTTDITDDDTVTLMLNLGNSVYYKINNLNSPKIFAANTIALCYSGVRTGFCRYQPQTTQLFALQIPRRMLLEYLDIMQIGQNILHMLQRQIPFFLMKPAEPTFRHIALKLSEHEQLSDALCRQLSYSFISDTTRYLLNDNAHQQYDNRCTNLEKAICILDREFILPPTITELARRVGTNETTLKQCFKKELNTTIHQYILLQRMIKAADLLSAQSYSVSHIAHEVGYSNHGHFASAFKKEFGCTPSSFISLKKSNTPPKPYYQHIK